MRDAEGLQERLGEVLRERWAASCRVIAAQRVGGGASRETWIVDVCSDSRERRLVLQRHLGKDLGGATTATQAAAMTAAATRGVPTPEVVLVLKEADGLGSGLVTEFVEGETNPRRVLEDARFADVRPDLARQCGVILAALHTIPSATPGLAEPWYTSPIERQIVACESVLDEIGEPHPAFELALRWLRDHAPDAGRRVVVHGDFRHGNLLIDQDGIRGVLDWELTHVGDPLEDLAWLCVRAWRFGQTDLPVGGFGDRATLLEAYAAAGGGALPERDLLVWELLGNVRWGTICMQQASRHLDGDEQSMELAAIGRRVCECEYDTLLTLSELAPGTYSAPSPWKFDDATLGTTGVVADRPDATALLTAVASSLRAEITPDLEGRPRFLSQVAANACRVVARELRHGDEVRAWASQAFERLLPSSRDPVAAVATALRAGDVSYTDEELVRAVTMHVGAKLTISNPRYFQDPDPTG